MGPVFGNTENNNRGGRGFGSDDLWGAIDQLRDGWEKTVGQGLHQGFGAFAGKAGARVNRGDVRVAILSLLAEQPMHGYQLIQQIEERSGGAWRPSPGSVYPTLQLLTDEGVIDVEEASGRKTYSLTEAGRAEAAEKPAPWAESAASDDQSATPGARGADARASALPKAGAHLAQAAVQVARTGSPEQIQRAIDLLDEARRGLYAILAEG